MKNKLTITDIIEWNGGYEDGLAEYLVSLLNDEFSLDDAKKEIMDYCGIENNGL